MAQPIKSNIIFDNQGQNSYQKLYNQSSEIHYQKSRNDNNSLNKNSSNIVRIKRPVISNPNGSPLNNNTQKSLENLKHHQGQNRDKESNRSNPDLREHAAIRITKNLETPKNNSKHKIQTSLYGDKEIDQTMKQFDSVDKIKKKINKMAQNQYDSINGQTGAQLSDKRFTFKKLGSTNVKTEGDVSVSKSTEFSDMNLMSSGHVSLNQQGAIKPSSDKNFFGSQIATKSISNKVLVEKISKKDLSANKRVNITDNTDQG